MIKPIAPISPKGFERGLYSLKTSLPNLELLESSRTKLRGSDLGKTLAKLAQSATEKRKWLVDLIRSNKARKLHDISDEMVLVPKTRVYMFSLPKSSEHDAGSAEDEIQYLLVLEDIGGKKLEPKSLLELDKEMAHDYTLVREILASKSEPVIDLDKHQKLKTVLESTTICNRI